LRPSRIVRRADLQRVLLNAIPPGIVETGAETTVRYSGQTCFRAIANFSARETGWLGEIQGKGIRFGPCPIDATRTYWWAAMNAPQGDRDDPIKRRELLMARYSGWGFEIPEMIAAASPDWQGGDAKQFVRFDNFRRALGDKVLWNVLVPRESRCLALGKLGFRLYADRTLRREHGVCRGHRHTADALLCRSRVLLLRSLQNAMVQSAVEHFYDPHDAAGHRESNPAAQSSARSPSSRFSVNGTISCCRRLCFATNSSSRSGSA